MTEQENINGQERLDNALASVAENAGEAYRVRALAVIRELCVRQEFVTADDVAREMEKYPEKPHHGRAVGSMILAAARLGYCEKHQCPHCGSVVTRENERIVGATPMRVWRSLLFTR